MIGLPELGARRRVTTGTQVLFLLFEQSKVRWGGMHLVTSHTRDAVSPVGRCQKARVFGVILVTVETLQRRPASRLGCKAKGQTTATLHVLAARPVAVLAVAFSMVGIPESGIDIFMAGSAQVVAHPGCLGMRHLK